MEQLSNLLKTENSDLARLLHFSLYGVEAALKQALTKFPDDPGAELCQGALQELNSLLQSAPSVSNTTHIQVAQTTENSKSTDLLEVKPPTQTGELKLVRLQKEFSEDKQLALHLGNIQLQSQTDSELWKEIQRQLLRVPEELVAKWRQRALSLAAEVGAQEDISNLLPLPFNKNENIFPGLQGTIKSQGLCFSTQAPLHEQITKLNLQNYQRDFPDDVNFIAAIVSTCIKFIDIEPNLHHALKSVFKFDIINLHSRLEQRSQYTDALLDSFWRMLKADADCLSALRHWIDLDEAINSLVFIPPADRFSWWGKLQQEVRHILLKKVAQRARSEGQNITIRQLSGLYGRCFSFV
ncbi:MAG: hypothetical protein KA716_01265 [Gloeotrichia echinulata DEX184]